MSSIFDGMISAAKFLMVFIENMIKTITTRHNNIADFPRFFSYEQVSCFSYKFDRNCFLLNEFTVPNKCMKQGFE